MKVIGRLQGAAAPAFSVCDDDRVPFAMMIARVDVQAEDTGKHPDRKGRSSRKIP
jgi:hypothetical protein